MIAYHSDGNLIFQKAFKTKRDRHCIIAYNAIMTLLAAQGLSVDIQILDNETSAGYKKDITLKWNAKSLSQSCQACIIATEWSAPFARSRTTSWQSWLVLMPRIPLTSYGTCSSHRVNSPSIACLRSTHWGIKQKRRYSTYTYY